MRRQQRVLRIPPLAPLLLCFLFCPTAARVPGADDLVVGDWNLNIQCGKNFFSSILFPTPRVDKPWSSSRPFGTRKNYPCKLSIFPNGTFALSPNDDNLEVNNILLLRGKWQIQPNPYCITDRFYDQLHLKSYPRRLVATPKEPPQSQSIIPFWKRDKRQAQTQQKTSLSLHCHVNGRYASSGIWRRLLKRPKQTKARLTHGLLVWENQNSNPNKPERPRVGASFQGDRLVRRYSVTPYQAEEDLKTFGY